MRLRILLVGSFVASLTAGCTINQHPAGLQDNLGTFTLDNSNALHTPYVAGSRFTITVEAGAHATNDGWKLTSSDPSVLQVGVPQGSGTSDFPVQAGASGHATLTVTDKNGNVIDTAGVDVAVPTRIQLCEQGLLYAGYTDDQAAVGSAQVVSGGTATFLARYFAGSQELFGNNALTASNSSLALAAVTSTSFSVRDFVQVTGVSTGTTSVHLAAGGTTLDLPVTVVDPGAVSSVTLAAQSESGASDNQVLFVFARALDSNGRDVYGSSFAWSAAGQSLAGNGNSNDPTDLLTYHYQSSGSENVMASVDGHAASATVHGAPSTTSTSTSENVGCSVGHGAGTPGSAAAGILVGLAILASRRRR
jgi:hypothetical protein